MKAKAFLEGRGTQYRPGAEFECSEEEGARLASIGAAEVAAVPVAVEVEEAAEQKTVPAALPDYNDVTRVEILDLLGQKVNLDTQLKRATKKALYQKLVEVWT